MGIKLRLNNLKYQYEKVRGIQSAFYTILKNIA